MKKSADRSILELPRSLQVSALRSSTRPPRTDPVHSPTTIGLVSGFHPNRAHPNRARSSEPRSPLQAALIRNASAHPNRAPLPPSRAHPKRVRSSEPCSNDYF
ncbi:MAG: hypothetical protein B6A08_16425 [Sorangiineae bacterium NIC37A_2]|nr:MAG: hypothetical protein B6A08_16425 [Sorangiineae bacterium NIC37A_2]